VIEIPNYDTEGETDQLISKKVYHGSYSDYEWKCFLPTSLISSNFTIVTSSKSDEKLDNWIKEHMATISDKKNIKHFKPDFQRKESQTHKIMGKEYYEHKIPVNLTVNIVNVLWDFWMRPSTFVNEHIQKKSVIIKV